MIYITQPIQKGPELRVVFGRCSRDIVLVKVKQNMADTQVHVGKGGSKYRLRRVLIGGGIVLLIVVLGLAAGAGVRWWQQKRQPAADKTQVLPKEVTDAQNLVFEGNYDKAHETINNALKDPNLSAQSKYDLLMQQAFTYEGQQNPDAAMDAYLDAEAVMQTMDVAQSIARLAAAKGDKELAISYYQKALTLIQNDDAMRVEYKKYFESMISVLQGGQPTYE